MGIGPNSLSDTFTQTYNSHGGTDIVATFNGVLVGNLNGVSYSTTREKAPIYVLGRTLPIPSEIGETLCKGNTEVTNKI